MPGRSLKSAGRVLVGFLVWAPGVDEDWGQGGDMGLPVVLMPGPMNPAVAEGLEGHCELIRLWEESNPDAVLAERRDEIVAVATGGTRIDGAFLDRLPAVRLVASFGVGYDRIDAGALAERGVVVTNTPGVLDAEVADTALGLLLMTVRELPEAERYLREDDRIRIADRLRKKATRAPTSPTTSPTWE